MSNEKTNKSCCEGNIESFLKTENALCPTCKRPGIKVKNITVKHLVINTFEEQVGETDYHICMNEECDIVYYNNQTNVVFSKNQIKVPIWFKKGANPKYACYCSKVTEEQVINAVVKNGANDLDEVLKLTGAMSNPQCQKNNPLGKCCHKIIQDAINKGLSIRNNI